MAVCERWSSSRTELELADRPSIGIWVAWAEMFYISETVEKICFIHTFLDEQCKPGEDQKIHANCFQARAHVHVSKKNEKSLSRKNLVEKK